MDAAVRLPMMYQLYQAQADLLQSMRRFARLGAGLTEWFGCGACTPTAVLLSQRLIGAKVFVAEGATQ